MCVYAPTQNHCNTLQHTATHCNTLQHTATHCNTLQYTAIHCKIIATHCNTLQHTATHCNTLQDTAIHCNTLHNHSILDDRLSHDEMHPLISHEEMHPLIVAWRNTSSNSDRRSSNTGLTALLLKKIRLRFHCYTLASINSERRSSNSHEEMHPLIYMCVYAPTQNHADTSTKQHLAALHSRGI